MQQDSLPLLLIFVITNWTVLYTAKVRKGMSKKEQAANIESQTHSRTFIVSKYVSNPYMHALIWKWNFTEESKKKRQIKKKQSLRHTSTTKHITRSNDNYIDVNVRESSSVAYRCVYETWTYECEFCMHTHIARCMCKKE